MRVVVVLIGALVLASLTPRVAHAQTTSTLANLQSSLQVKRKIVVLTDTSMVRGAFAGASASDIRLASNGSTIRLEASKVRAVGTLDHRPGLVGTAVGAGAGLAFGIIVVEMLRDCGGCGANGAPAFRLAMTGAGAAVGAGLSATPERLTWVYRRPKAAVALTPTVGRSGNGLRVRIAWQ